MAFDVKTDDARCIREASFIEKLFRDEKERFYFLKDKVSLQRFLFSLSLFLFSSPHMVLRNAFRNYKNKRLARRLKSL